jgi:molybdate transport repressor ModE-like protein
MEPKFKMWIEDKGEVVISTWRAEFLQAIASTGSLVQAAKKLNIPILDAEHKLMEMEERSGLKLVTTSKQEPGQNNVRLTREGEGLLKKFQEFSTGFDAEVAERYKRAFRK